MSYYSASVDLGFTNTLSAIPASALNEDEDDDEESSAVDERDDERYGTRYNASRSFCRPLIITHFHDCLQYTWFHVIFTIGAMYVAMLLTDWYVFQPSSLRPEIYIVEQECRQDVSHRGLRYKPRRRCFHWPLGSRDVDACRF